MKLECLNWRQKNCAVKTGIGTGNVSSGEGNIQQVQNRCPRVFRRGSSLHGIITLFFVVVVFLTVRKIQREPARASYKEVGSCLFV